MASVGVSRMGKTSVVFVEPGAKINSQYYCEKVLGQGVLPDIRTRCGRYKWTLYSKTGRHRILLEALCNISSVKTSTLSSRTCGPQTALCCLGSASGDGLPLQNVHVCTRTKTCHCHLGSNCHKRFLTEVSVNGGVALKTWYNVMVDTSSMFVELKSTTLVLWT